MPILELVLCSEIWKSNIVKVDIYSWVYISVNNLFPD